MRGRITTALNLDLTYDNNNRLAVADTGVIQEYYLYDATGAMVARGDDEGGFEQFAYDGQHMIGAYEQGIAKWEATYTSGQDQMIGFYDCFRRLMSRFDGAEVIDQQRYGRSFGSW